MSEQRRLAAIVAADVVGYSRLMGRDESGTLARLRAHRTERLEPILKRHGGRLVKLTGDGALVEFSSAVEAVSAAIELQQAMAEANRDQPDDRAIVFRIGVHLGDLIVDGDDIYGDGVNVAARLEGESPPGGILISGNLHDAVAGRLKAKFDDLGDLRLKNIERPVRAYQVTWNAGDWPVVSGAAAASPTLPAPAQPGLALPDKPSIAVLPFQNMSGDPEQEYFVDGLVEDIITALSRFKSLFVIARNSSFTYKGKAVDVRQVGRELGVRYVLEGSVRKAGGKVRITGQLVQADTGAHIWAERYDGDLADIFDLQDQVTLSVVGAMAPKLEQAEIERVKSKATENLGAYDLYLRGLARLYVRRPDPLEEARQFGYHAIALDPNYAAAHAMVAFADAFLIGTGRSPSPAGVAETARLARRAIELAGDDTTVLSMAAWALAHVVRDLDTALAASARAIKLNPNLATASFVGGWTMVWNGRHDEAIGHFAHALRLSPLDPTADTFKIGLAHAHYMAGNLDEAIRIAESTLQDRPGPVVARIAAAANGLAGRQEAAQRCLAVLQRFDPEQRLSTLSKVLGPYRRSEDRNRYAEGLRLAGMPE